MIGKRTTDEWIGLIESKNSGLISQLKSIYGQHDDIIDDRLHALHQVAQRFRVVYGNKKVRFSRAPGRLNTLSMHSDHRGSYINPISLNREVIICFAPRDDDKVDMYNENPYYGERYFSIQNESSHNGIYTESGWLEWTQYKTDERKKAGINDDWINKLKSVPVYLQTRFPDKKLRGFEGILHGDIPSRAGLSSSSAIIVATMDIMTDVNDIHLDDKAFVRFCGIAEWYVGTRGGFGDQAAIKLGKLGKITHMTTLPELVIDSYLPFPEGYEILIFNSEIKADKTGSAVQKFNEKTATYEIGEIYIRKYMKQYHAEVYQNIVDSRANLEIEKKFHLADVIECLNKQEIYAMLETVPEKISRKELLRQLPEEITLLKRQFSTHDEPADDYPVRLVITYGICECKRGKMLKEVLEQKDVEMFGKLMCISHNGDRVCLDSPRYDCCREIFEQPGNYGCSIPEIDNMVDIAIDAGAVGAQISGAGMGGSMMALVKEKDADIVIEAMHNKYYVPHGFDDNVIVANAIEGAGIL